MLVLALQGRTKVDSYTVSSSEIAPFKTHSHRHDRACGEREFWVKPVRNALQCVAYGVCALATGADR
ncbi:hypothetical protein J2S43_003252 [Catenuloplanes nepalensis]|uniref:Uncharacterized protein n=1 Tax=Catenuloplanes nepalensis TaxID=587533 RepID=A0ABT9MTI0_9ACTN|nr:hypothetical protein [Catenuloplanes nepalensis]